MLWTGSVLVAKPHDWQSWMTALGARRLSWRSRRSEEGLTDFQENLHSRRRTVACRLESSNRHRASHHKLPFSFDVQGSDGLDQLSGGSGSGF